jgi:AmmeMemoRadiSam system protein B/AmmeMemoRadiSam system protein A
MPAALPLPPTMELLAPRQVNQQVARQLNRRAVLQLHRQIHPLPVNDSYNEGADMFRLANKRPLKFAGTWYESDPKKLSTQFDAFDANARAKVDPLAKALDGRPILAIVAPHAGYAFSGATAACSYLAPESKKVKRVFLLGPSHYKAFHGAAVSGDKSFATVFGDLSVDNDVIADLKNDHHLPELSDVHRDEHSLEMQLAFIRRDYGNVKIVPLLIGRLEDASEARFIGTQIRSELKEGDLVVVSSDFTHYGPLYGYAPFAGQGGDLAQHVKRLDMEAFSYLERNDLDGFFDFYKKTEDTICGVYALAVLMAMLPEDAKGHLIDYRTSRDSIVEDDQNSVSYLAIAFAGSAPWGDTQRRSAEQEDLTETEKTTLLKLARTTLETFVRSGKAPRPDQLGVDIDERLKKPQGVFVTLFQHKPNSDEDGHATTGHGREGKELRGCIGYIMPVKPLYQAVMDNAMSAASKDLRFEPVSEGELDLIEIEISVLTSPKKVASYGDIRVGTDGVLLYCQGRQSVFLPHVATEFGWDVDETLCQLAVKAGLPRLAWKGPSARFEVFQAISMEEKSPFEVRNSG